MRFLSKAAKEKVLTSRPSNWPLTPPWITGTSESTHTSVTPPPTPPSPTTESLTGVSKEHRALFNHSRGWGVSSMKPEAPVRWLDPGGRRVLWHRDGQQKERSPPISHVSAAPVRLDAKCRMSMSSCVKQLPASSERAQTGVGEEGGGGGWVVGWVVGGDMVLPAMSAESLKLYHFRKVSGGHSLHFPLTSSTLIHPHLKSPPTSGTEAVILLKPIFTHLAPAAHFHWGATLSSHCTEKQR